MTFESQIDPRSESFKGHRNDMLEALKLVQDAEAAVRSNSNSKRKNSMAEDSSYPASVSRYCWTPTVGSLSSAALRASRCTMTTVPRAPLAVVPSHASDRLKAFAAQFMYMTRQLRAVLFHPWVCRKRYGFKKLHWRTVYP